MADTKDAEKGMDIAVAPELHHSHSSVQEGDLKEPVEQEVFQKGVDGVEFRTVTWPRASVIFLKVLFATGVLSIPSAMFVLGSVGGALCLLGFGLFNCYVGIIQGDFRNKHPSCHSVADMAGIMAGPIARELVGGLYVIAWVLCSGSGIVGVSVAFNALSDHSECTVWFAFIAAIIIALCASIRTFQNLGWLTWAGFVSIYVAVFIIVVAVTTRNRPAAAPQTGPYELGFHAIGHATFSAGIVAACTIFISSAGTSAFIPIIAEMKNPKDYRKSLYLCMSFVTASYLTFALVVYAWCGNWIASPALGSAGPTMKKVSYGIGLIGLIVSGCLYAHIAAKYLFVRILRNSQHLQSNTLVHWGTWLGCTIGVAAVAFILAEAIPIFNFLVALTASVCFAPLAMMLPGWIWLYDHGHYKSGHGIVKMILYWAHWLLIAIGLFFCVGGTYGTIKEIVDAYASGLIGGAFSCADNSGTVGAA